MSVATTYEPAQQTPRLQTIGAVCRRRQRAALATEEQELTVDELCARAGIAASALRDLEGFGLLQPTVVRGERRYRESDVEVAALCAQLAAYGMSARHLRTFQTSAD